MKEKMDFFCEVWDELGVPVRSIPRSLYPCFLNSNPRTQYTVPSGGYFVLANLSALDLPSPEEYDYPPHVLSRARDFRLCWWLIREIGVAAIPPTEFYKDGSEGVAWAEDYLRFAVCKDREVLEEAKKRLRGLKAHLKRAGEI